MVSNTGAYGGHASETLAAAMGSPLAAYRCDNKKGIGKVVYTNMIPAGGFRGYGASQSTFAIECAIDAPAGKPCGVAVVCHPHPQFGGTMDNKVVQTLARAFVQLGWRSVRFNFRGIGGSAGRSGDVVSCFA